MHREFVHHIVEDEADGQEGRQDDREEDRQQWRSRRESNTQHERMEMTHGM